MIMKTNILLLFVCFVVLFTSSCHSIVYFTESQPAGKKQLSSFPGRYQRSFLDTADNSSYLVTGSSITKISRFTADFHIRDTDKIMDELKDILESDDVGIDTTMAFFKEIMSELPGGSLLVFRKKGDSLFFTASFTDTLFHLSDTNVLKRHRGSLYLNQLDKDSLWSTARLKRKGNILVYSIISENKAVDKLKQITQTSPADSTKVFSLSRKQFDAFVRNGGFTIEKVLIRESGM